MNDMQTCDHCGMHYYEWLHADFRFEGEPLIPNMHVCPEPFDPEVARMLLACYSSLGIPTTQRIKARIRLGLEG